MAKTASHFEELSVDKAVKELKTNPEKGLSKGEVKKRLTEYGENTISEEKRNPAQIFLSHLWGPIPWMIEIAAILAGVVRRWEELGVILAMLMVNGGIGFWHENKANSAIQALKEKLSPKAKVLREGKEKTISSKELVPGDIISVRIGDVVPADAKLLKDQHMSLDESALTGESLPVDKEGNDLAYSGTSVKRGEAKAIVVATGKNTKFAKTAELVQTAGGESHFQKAVLRIGRFLIATTGVLVGIIVAVSVSRGDPWIDILVFALGLTISGIPVALPAVLSVTMSIGANRLAKMKAIVSRLAAMEEIAGLDILCADKTGTLTKNELELQDPVLLESEDKHDIVLSAALTAERDTDDPIDNAILGGLDKRSELDKYQIRDFRGFDPTKKRAEADVEHNGEKFSVAKGAPQAILELMSADRGTRDKVSKKVDELGEQGFRSLGVARTDKNGKWHYLGILPLLDPPREDTAKVIKDARGHGIDIRMVTGDHEAIGKQVAGQVGLGQNFKKAKELFREHKGSHDQVREGGQINKDVLSSDGFAEVTPEHKFKIVRQFQSNGHIVGMTGDGVNDAPALKQADVGIAVAGATDAARSAAALILTAKGLGVITRAIEEARRIFERMNSYATFRITETIRILLFVSISILALNFYPITPIMIVLLAILNDIPIITIAWDNVPTPDHPVRWDMRRVITIASTLGGVGVGATFLLYWVVTHPMGLSGDIVQTIMFLKLLVAGHFTIFITRNRGLIWQKPWPNLKLIGALEGTQVAGTLAAVYGWIIHPIGWEYAGIVWGYAAMEMLVLSGIKVLVYKILSKGIKLPARIFRRIPDFS